MFKRKQKSAGKVVNTNSNTSIKKEGSWKRFSYTAAADNFDDNYHGYGDDDDADDADDADDDADDDDDDDSGGGGEWQILTIGCH